MPNDKFYRMLGLATRAGKVVCGEGAVADSVRCGKAQLIIISADASENTAKKFKNSAAYYSLPLLTAEDRFILGKAVGREFAVTVAVCDKNFADALKKEEL